LTQKKIKKNNSNKKQTKNQKKKPKEKTKENKALACQHRKKNINQKEVNNRK